ncbi:hypothetical protein [Victivallis vadensis]|uniref:hypothetical protein n=1 Tax=Victivallis vadensis TaxID=172901 RepID=UPI0026DC3E29|nr:hypothetical protein [Victivallis vadensis]
MRIAYAAFLPAPDNLNIPLMSGKLQTVTSSSRGVQPAALHEARRKSRGLAINDLNEDGYFEVVPQYPPETMTFYTTSNLPTDLRRESFSFGGSKLK